jgi:hypothetical protein
MGVWDIMHLTHQYKKWLALALREDITEKDRKAYWVNAENARVRIAKYLERYGTQHLEALEVRDEPIS